MLRSKNLSLITHLKEHIACLNSNLGDLVNRLRFKSTKYFAR